MANFIISPLAISFDSIKNNLQTFAQSLAADRTWQDFYTSSTGETIIEIIAALGAFYAYHFIMGRRESYLPVAENYSSVVGLAQNNGYSCYRGNNIKGQLTVLPKKLTQTITIHKWDRIGQYGEYDIIAMNEDPIIIGGSIRPTVIDVPIVIGNLKRQEVDTATNDITTFSFYSDSITEDFRLLLNEDPVPTSDIISDALKDYYITISNSYGGIDVFYLQQGKYKYNSSSVLACEFIERNNLDANNLTLTAFSTNITVDDEIIEWTDQINDFKITSNGIDKEAIDYIKVRAPLFHETSMVIRSRKDYAKYLLLKNAELIEVNDRDINPGLIELTYLKEDGTFMSSEEKEAYLDAIEESRPTGVARAIISEPVQIYKELLIKLWKSSNEDYPITLGNDIQAILDKYNHKFAKKVDLDQIEHDLEKLSGVKIARVDLDSAGEWKDNEVFYHYDSINTDYGTFFVSDYHIYSDKALSGTNQPSWGSGLVVDNEINWQLLTEIPAGETKVWSPQTSFHYDDIIKIPIDATNSYYYKCVSFNKGDWSNTIDDIIYDNNLIWKVVDTYKSTVVHTWKADHPYALYDCIKKEVISDGTYGSSGTTPPSWGADELQDGYITWEKTVEPEEGVLVTSWLEATVFHKNDIIKVNYIVEGEQKEDYYQCKECRQVIENVVYQVVNYRAKTVNKPDGSLIFHDGILVWSLYTEESDDTVPPSSYVDYETDAYYKIGDMIRVDEKYYYLLTSISGRTSDTEPNWSEATNELPNINDGNIVWTKLAESSRKINLNWNEVLNLTYKMEQVK